MYRTCRLKIKGIVEGRGIDPDSSLPFEKFSLDFDQMFALVS